MSIKRNFNLEDNLLNYLKKIGEKGQSQNIICKETKIFPSSLLRLRKRLEPEKKILIKEKDRKIFLIFNSKFRENKKPTFFFVRCNKCEKKHKIPLEKEWKKILSTSFNSSSTNKGKQGFYKTFKCCKKQQRISYKKSILPAQEDYDDFQFYKDICNYIHKINEIHHLYNLKHQSKKK